MTLRKNARLKKCWKTPDKVGIESPNTPKTPFAQTDLFEGRTSKILFKQLNLLSGGAKILTLTLLKQKLIKYRK